jgi:membrane-associated phospholipid phosphatase
MYTNFDISKREQRGSIFAFAAVLTSLYMASVILFGGPKVLLYSLFGLLMGVVIASLINTKIKASIHMAVYSAFALVLAFFYGSFFWILVIGAPLVAWSRIILKRHKLLETIVGTVLGIFIVIALYLVVKYILQR